MQTQQDLSKEIKDPLFSKQQMRESLVLVCPEMYSSQTGEKLVGAYAIQGLQMFLEADQPLQPEPHARGFCVLMRDSSVEYLRTRHLMAPFGKQGMEHWQKMEEMAVDPWRITYGRGEVVSAYEEMESAT